MTNQPRYSYTTSKQVGRRIRSERRMEATSFDCYGENLVMSVRSWSSAARRPAADWGLLATASGLAGRRADVFFLSLIMAPCGKRGSEADRQTTRTPTAANISRKTGRWLLVSTAVGRGIASRYHFPRVGRDRLDIEVQASVCRPAEVSSLAHLCQAEFGHEIPQLAHQPAERTH